MPVEFIVAIRMAFEEALAEDETVIIIGEGVPDPKAIFSSTQGLQQKFGKHRVFDMPLSENALTGICLGAAVKGLKPVLIHQRIDFALLAMDQMVNHAAKWHYMFNGLQNVPMVIRVIIGKGWGQGPQHSQALWGMMALVPGLKIFLPVTAQEAKEMMLAAIAEPNPVLFVEHRWLHGIQSNLSSQTLANIEKPCFMREGRDITLMGWSYSVIECLNVAQALSRIGIEAEVINLRVGHPFELEGVLASVEKTGKAIIHDLHHEQNAPAYSLSAKLQAQSRTELMDSMGAKGAIDIIDIRVLAQPNHPVPTSWHQAQYYYSEAPQILKLACEQLGLSQTDYQQASDYLSRPPKPDVPNLAFRGPF